MSEPHSIEQLNQQTHSWTAHTNIDQLNQCESTRITEENLPLYSVGDVKDLSMARYAATICLNRAATLEAESVTLMETLSQNTEALEILAHVEDECIAAVQIDSTYYVKDFDVTVNGKSQSWVDYLRKDLACDFSVMAYQSYPRPEYYDEGLIPNQYYVYLTAEQYETLVNVVESKMDALNSLGQDVMIDLQALLDKRDQSYTLLTALLKVCGDTARTISMNF
ncbi:MAG: hypothetical protein IJV69_05470 [Kiritimatiellae bacterium]|nr:hypothetical protein [Kiritimatiellia bacterium]